MNFSINPDNFSGQTRIVGNMFNNNATLSDESDGDEFTGSEFSNILKEAMGSPNSKEVAPPARGPIPVGNEPPHHPGCKPDELSVLEETNWETLVQEADTNGDGQLSAEELEAVLKSKVGHQLSPMFTQFFSHLSQGDNLVSQSDFESFQAFATLTKKPSLEVSASSINPISAIDDISTEITSEEDPTATS